MSIIVISGVELCRKEISGVERYNYEIVTRLDRLLITINAEERPDIRICYLADEQLQLPKLQCIRVVPLERRAARSKSKDICDYARKNKAILVNLAPRFITYAKQIITLYDVRPLEKEHYDSFRYRVNFLLIRAWLKMHPGIRVVTISKYQKRRIHSLCGIAAKRIAVIGCGWEHIDSIQSDDSVLDRLGLAKEGYYLAIGSIACHKNYEWLVRMAEKYPAEKFVIAGRENALKGGYRLEHGNTPNLILTGYVSEEEKKALLENCTALLHPSKYEGFGIPPLEALALGRKIAVSDVCCMKEIYRKSATYFDPDHGAISLQEIENADPEEEKKVLQKYTWENAASGWLELLKSL